jgi:hypothetical protein
LAVDFLVVDGEHAVDLGDVGVGVEGEVFIELPQFLQHYFELGLVDGLDDEPVVGSEEEELPAFASVLLFLRYLIDLVEVLHQVETARDFLHSVSHDQFVEDAGSVDGEFSLEE